MKIVKFENEKFGIRKLTFNGWKYLTILKPYWFSKKHLYLCEYDSIAICEERIKNYYKKNNRSVPLIKTYSVKKRKLLLYNDMKYFN